VCTSPQSPLRLPWSDRHPRSRKSKVPVFSSHSCWQPCFSFVWGFAVLSRLCTVCMVAMVILEGHTDTTTCTPGSMQNGSWTAVRVLALGSIRRFRVASPSGPAYCSAVTWCSCARVLISIFAALDAALNMERSPGVVYYGNSKSLGMALAHGSLVTAPQGDFSRGEATGWRQNTLCHGYQ
jgi:hypothetical protein